MAIDMSKVYNAAKPKQQAASPESIQHVCRVIRNGVNAEDLQQDMEHDFIKLAKAGYTFANIDASYNNSMSLFSFDWTRLTSDAEEHGITRITRQNQQAYLESSEKIKDIIEDMLDSNRISYRLAIYDVYPDAWRIRYLVRLTQE